MPLSDIDIDLESDGEMMIDLDDGEMELMNGVVLEASKKKRHGPSGSAMNMPSNSFLAFANQGKQNVPRPSNNAPEEMEDHQESEGGYDIYGGEEEMDESQRPSPGYKNIDDERADLLNKITRLERKGLRTNERFTMNSNIQDVRNEVKRMASSIEIDQSVKMQRRILMACVTGIEFMNKRYNPLDIHLDGWSESIMDGIDEYDDVFEELHIKYRGAAKIAPELKLMMMVGGSATMFHLTHSMFKSAMPQMQDIIKQNPDLVKNMMSAVANTANNAQRGPPLDPRPPPQVQRREVQGPNVDLSNLMSTFMMPQSTTTKDAEETNTNTQHQGDYESIMGDDISDIVSVESGSVRDVEVGVTKKKRGRKGKTTTTLEI